MVAASLNVAADGASSAGTYGNHFYIYPSGGVTLLGKGWLPLTNSTLVNRLNLRAEYGLSGNSRFSSLYDYFRYCSCQYIKHHFETGEEHTIQSRIGYESVA